MSDGKAKLDPAERFVIAHKEFRQLEREALAEKKWRAAEETSRYIRGILVQFEEACRQQAGNHERSV